MVDGEATPLLRLDQVLPVSAGAEANPLFLLLPKNSRRPLAIVATAIIDTEALPAELNAPRSRRTASWVRRCSAAV